MYSSLSLNYPHLFANLYSIWLPLIASTDVVEDDEAVDKHELMLLHLAGVLSLCLELLDHALGRLYSIWQKEVLPQARATRWRCGRGPCQCPPRRCARCTPLCLSPCRDSSPRTLSSFGPLMKNHSDTLWMMMIRLFAKSPLRKSVKLSNQTTYFNLINLVFLSSLFLF